MKRFLLALLLLVPGLLFAQGAQRVGQATVNVGGYVKVVSGATITVCTYPNCGVASVYADVGLTVPLSNPFFADANGNYSYYVTPGTYFERVFSPGTGTFTRVITTQGGTSFDLASPPPIGNITPNTGAFTTLTSTGGALNGTIGAGTPNTGAFTSLTSSSGALNGSIGAITPNTGAFTTGVFSGAVSTPQWQIDSNFYANIGSSNPVIVWNPNTYTFYDRSGLAYNWVDNSNTNMTLPQSGVLNTRGGYKSGGTQFVDNAGHVDAGRLAATTAVAPYTALGTGGTGLGSLCLLDNGTWGSCGALPSQGGHSGQYLGTNGSVASWSTPPGGGNVTGPGSSVTNHVAEFADTTGTLLKDGGALPVFPSGAAYNYYANSSSGGTTPQSVSPLEYAAELFGVVADGSTDNTSAINTAATTLAGLGVPTRLRLPIGVTLANSGALILKTTILVGSGTNGWNAGGLSAPTSYLHLTSNTGTTPQIQCLVGGWCGLEHLVVVNDANNSVMGPLYTCGIPWLFDVLWQGETAAGPKTNACDASGPCPVNDAIRFGTATFSTPACGVVNAPFGGYGDNYIHNLYFENIRLAAAFNEQARGIHMFDVRTDFTDANPAGYAIQLGEGTGGTSGNPVNGNIVTFSGEQAPFGATNGGSFDHCNYKELVGLTTWATSNQVTVNDDDTGNCAHIIQVTDSSSQGNWLVVGSGFVSGTSILDVGAGSANNTTLDLPNRIFTVQLLQTPNIGTSGLAVNHVTYGIYTITGGLPTPAQGEVVWVGDSADGTCTNGTGSTHAAGIVQCIYNGTAWVPTDRNSGSNGIMGGADVIRVSKTGLATTYYATNYSNNLWTTITTAANAGSDGDTLYVAGETFDAGSTCTSTTKWLDLSVGGTGTINLHGMGPQTVIERAPTCSPNGPLVQPGILNNRITDATLIDYETPANGRTAPPILNRLSSGGTAYYDVVGLGLERLHITGVSDGYIVTPVSLSSGYIKDSVIVTQWDANTFNGAGGTVNWTIDNTATSCSPDAFNTICTCWRATNSIGTTNLTLKNGSKCTITSAVSGAIIKALDLENTGTAAATIYPGGMVIDSSGVSGAGATNFDITLGTNFTTALFLGDAFYNTAKVNGAAHISYSTVLDNVAATGNQGTGALIQRSTGSTTLNDCGQFDANGNIIDSGGPCAATGAPGELLQNGSLTRTPSLGDGTHTGTLQLFNASFGASTTVGTNAASSYTVKFFSSLPASNAVVICFIASTTCTLTDSGITASSGVLTVPVSIKRTGVAFASLDASPTAGEEQYCSDCQVTTAATCSTTAPASCVCKASGTGAFAKYVNYQGNGANWYCQ